MSQPRGEMPIFTKITEFLAWITPQTDRFPKVHRMTVTRRLLDAAYNLMERTVEANNARGNRRAQLLNQADMELDKVRLYLRLAYRWQWFSDGQYEHAARMIAEIGRLLGAWKKQTRQ